MPLFLDGSLAIAHGAIDAGCNFFAGYPITPASVILQHMMRLLPMVGGVAVQGEDEIASIGFCLGAAATGAKALTATSGPGMSLYSENIGLAVMTETPLVIVDVQRMGPATGGATTTAEGDVQFCRWVTSGGYPMVVFAATNPADAYRLTIEAFNVAETLRTPVILLTSMDLAMTTETALVDRFTRPKVVERRGGEGPPFGVADPADVPPFVPIGGARLTRVTGSIHDEHGVITSDSRKIERKLRHLQRKIGARADDLARVEEDLQPDASELVIAYGIAARAARAAVREARAHGRRISLLVLHTLWPVPERAIERSLLGVRRVIVPEMNPGQYVREVERLGSGRDVVSVTRLDGGLLDPASILAEVRA